MRKVFKLRDAIYFAISIGAIAEDVKCLL